MDIKNALLFYKRNESERGRSDGIPYGKRNIPPSPTRCKIFLMVGLVVTGIWPGFDWLTSSFRLTCAGGVGVGGSLSVLRVKTV